MLAGLILLRCVADCPTAEIPAALNDAGVKARKCFFGNPVAAEKALREAARKADCVQSGTPLECRCPPVSNTPSGGLDCTNWAVNLVRFYSASDEAPFVKELTDIASKACATVGGRLLRDEERESIKPDTHEPACHWIEPTAPADLAAFTVRSQKTRGNGYGTHTDPAFFSGLYCCTGGEHRLFVV